MKLLEIFSKAQTEEELKNIFAKFFHLKLDTKNFIDLYTPQILFEFKFDENLKNIQVLSKCFAQTLYYVRRLKFGRDIRKPSENICVVTKNFAAFAKTKNFSNFYSNNNFDWDLAPSSPCKKLVAALADSDFLKNIHVYDFSINQDESNFIKLINQTLTAQLSLFEDKKIIDENNFFPIFEYWQKLFGNFVENGKKSSEYFITDIEFGKSFVNDNKIFFRMNDGSVAEKFINVAEYNNFWNTYEKIKNPREIIAIRQKMDRMTELDLRRRTGEFFTPINFAEKAVDYLRRTVKFDKNFRIWDMCAGTGNLEFALPAEWLKFTYISTLLDDDANYCKKISPDATVFQYDYLNDDVQFFYDNLFEKFFDKKMPKNLIADLKNPKIKWIIFINPPYAMAGNFARKIDKVNKDGVANTAIQKFMKKENLGESARELYAQFLYRINLEFKNKITWLGMFSKTNYIFTINDQDMHKNFLDYKFESGFIFSSENFEGCKGKFPVSFAIWDMNKHLPLLKQKISLDIFNSEVEKIGIKTYKISEREKFLRDWSNREKTTKKFPPMSSALKIAKQNKDRRDKIADGFLASLMCSGTDFSHANYTALLSGPYASVGGISITEKNFERCMVIHSVRKIPKATWINDKDQFMQPTKNLSREFICDCVIWSLFSPSNQTVSLRNVEYEGEVYRMKNNLFPFMLEEIRDWEISDAEIKLQVAMATEDRFAALWIKNNFADISAESRAVLLEGRNVYKVFYENLEAFDLKRLKIEDWDIGWYQIRMSLADVPLGEGGILKGHLKSLGAKILPQIYELGFLRDEVKYF